MSEKEKYYRLNLLKKVFFISLIFLNLFIKNSYSLQNQAKITINKIKENFIKTNSLSFHFKQKINDKTEVGRCLIKYPKLIHCYYDNKAKKELISDGYTFAIYKKKYNKIYLYPLITLTLNHLLNKEFILRELLPENHKRLKITDKIIEFEVYNKKQKIIDKLPDYIFPLCKDKKVRGYYVEGYPTHDKKKYPKKVFDFLSCNRKNLLAAKRHIESLEIKNKDAVFMAKNNNLPAYVSYEKHPKGHVIGYRINNYPIRDKNGVKIGHYKKKFSCTKETMEEKYKKAITYLNEIRT